MHECLEGVRRPWARCAGATASTTAGQHGGGGGFENPTNPRPWVSEKRTGALGALCGRDSERHSRPSAAAAATGSVYASEPAGRAASSDVSATPCLTRPLAGAGGGNVVTASPRAAVNSAVTGSCVCRGTHIVS